MLILSSAKSLRLSLEPFLLNSNRKTYHGRCRLNIRLPAEVIPVSGKYFLNVLAQIELLPMVNSHLVPHPIGDPCTSRCGHLQNKKIVLLWTIGIICHFLKTVVVGQYIYIILYSFTSHQPINLNYAFQVLEWKERRKWQNNNIYCSQINYRPYPLSLWNSCTYCIHMATAIIIEWLNDNCWTSTLLWTILYWE